MSSDYLSGWLAAREEAARVCDSIGERMIAESFEARKHEPRRWSKHAQHAQRGFGFKDAAKAIVKIQPPAGGEGEPFMVQHSGLTIPGCQRCKRPLDLLGEKEAMRGPALYALWVDRKHIFCECKPPEPPAEGAMIVEGRIIPVPQPPEPALNMEAAKIVHERPIPFMEPLALEPPEPERGVTNHSEALARAVSEWLAPATLRGDIPDTVWSALAAYNAERGGKG